VAVTSAGPYADHLHLTPDRYHASTTSLVYLQAGCSSCCPTNIVKALNAYKKIHYKEKTKDRFGCLLWSLAWKWRMLYWSKSCM